MGAVSKRMGVNSVNGGCEQEEGVNSVNGGF